MKKALILIFVNLFLNLLQESFLGNLFSFDLIPNLVLALSFGFMLNSKDDMAYQSAFIGGLLHDFLTFHVIGESSLILLVCLFLFSLFRRYVSKSIFSSFLGIFISNTIFVLLTSSGEIYKLDSYLINGFITFSASFVMYLLIDWFSTSFRKNMYSIRQ